MLGYKLKENAKVVTSKALHHSTYTYLPIVLGEDILANRVNYGEDMNEHIFFCTDCITNTYLDGIIKSIFKTDYI